MSHELVLRAFLPCLHSATLQEGLLRGRVPGLACVGDQDLGAGTFDLTVFSLPVSRRFQVQALLV